MHSTKKLFKKLSSLLTVTIRVNFATMYKYRSSLNEFLKTCKIKIENKLIATRTGVFKDVFVNEYITNKLDVLIKAIML